MFFIFFLHFYSFFLFTHLLHHNFQLFSTNIFLHYFFKSLNNVLTNFPQRSPRSPLKVPQRSPTSPSKVPQRSPEPPRGPPELPQNSQEVPQNSPEVLQNPISEVFIKPNTELLVLVIRPFLIMVGAGFPLGGKVAPNIN